MEEVFHAALALAGPERETFVASRCDDDTLLHDEVKSLLLSDDSLDNFLQEPVAHLSFVLLAEDKAFRPTEVSSEPSAQLPRKLEGQRVGGRYEVIKRIGGGGFGDVYKAVDTKIMSRAVVIKVLRDDLLDGDEVKRNWAITKFKQEIEALAKIDDPGVVHILDADSLPDGRPYIVMEFVDGVDLRHFMKEARLVHATEQGLKFEDVAEIVKQVGRTLSAAHKQDIFHRDLKPENIMLRRNSSGDLQVKVIDFGIARVRNSLVAPSTATGHFFVGTWQYMSPEQLARKKTDAPADIYSFGVIAFEMLTFRYPFPASDAAQLRDLQGKEIKIKPCDLVPALPVSAQDAILKAINYFPAERYERARDFGDKLAIALATEDELVRPMPRPEIDLEGETVEQDKVNVVSPPSASRWPYLLVAISIAAVIGVTAWWTFKTFVQGREVAQQTVVPVGPERSLSFWLNVRMPKGDGSFDEFESTGEEAFKAGSKIYFRVQPSEDGYLYIINEGMGENGTRKWTALFPNPGDNNSTARLSGNKLQAITGMTLDDNPGDEIIHFVWATSPVGDLDPLFSFAMKNTRDGVLLDHVHQSSLTEFFQRNQEDPGGRSFVNGAQPRVNLKGHGNLLVGSITIKHRKYGSS